jgi:hypothetical protein
MRFHTTGMTTPSIQGRCSPLKVVQDFIDGSTCMVPLDFIQKSAARR